MKRLSLVVWFSVLACSSSTPATNSNIVQPEVDLYQVIGPADMNYPKGAIEVQFAVHVANRSAEAITLRQVDIVPVGLGGPYRVRTRTYPINEQIAANGSRDIEFWAQADASGDQFANDANAPVSVRAIAHFQTAGGSFRKILMKTFSQDGSGPRGRS
jgi:hypothetical protein